MIKKIIFFAIIAVVVILCGSAVFADDDRVPNYPVTTAPASGEAPSVTGGTSQGTATAPVDSQTNNEGSQDTDNNTISLYDAVYGTDIEETEQFMVKITKPENGSAVFKYREKQTICGYTTYKGVNIVLVLYDSDEDAYEDLATTDGVSSWEIGPFGLFTREITLPVGTHKIKLVAYIKAEEDSLKPGENLQISCFTITVKKESTVDKLLNEVKSLTEVIQSIFNQQQ